MLRFDDFFHLPQLDQAIGRVAADQGGLVVIAGLDPRALAGVAEGELLPSGRTTVFRALVGMVLGSARKALVVAESRDTVRVPRRVQVLPVRPPRTYADTIAAAWPSAYGSSTASTISISRWLSSSMAWSAGSGARSVRAYSPGCSCTKLR